MMKWMKTFPAFNLYYYRNNREKKISVACLSPKQVHEQVTIAELRRRSYNWHHLCSFRSFRVSAMNAYLVSCAAHQRRESNILQTVLINHIREDILIYCNCSSGTSIRWDIRWYGSQSASQKRRKSAVLLCDISDFFYLLCCPSIVKKEKKRWERRELIIINLLSNPYIVSSRNLI